MLRIRVEHVFPNDAFQKEAVTLILKQLSFIIKQNNQSMATLAELQTALTDLQTSVDTHQQAVLDAIDALKEQIGSGGTVTEADLDALILTVKSIQTDVDSSDLDGSGN